MQEYNEGKIAKNISNQDYQLLLKCVSDKDRKDLSRDDHEFPYLYPNKDDPNFNIKIAKKKNFLIQDMKHMMKKIMNISRNIHKNYAII